MDFVTTGLGAGSYPEPPAEKYRVDDDDYETALNLAYKYPQQFQDFSDEQNFKDSFEGESWNELSEEEQHRIIRNAMRIYNSADDCRRFKREYLKRHCFEYEDYLREAGVLHG